MIASVVALATAQLSGLYGPMLVAVNGQEVHGVFSETRIGNGSERAPQFSCYFSFKGELRGDTALLTVQTPGDHASSGTVRFSSESVRLQLESNQPGCSATSGDMVGQPYEVGRESAGDGWTAVALIVAPAAVIRSAPSAQAKAKMRLSRGGAVAVLGQRDRWSEVVWPYGDAPIRGWIPDVALSRPNQ